MTEILAVKINQSWRENIPPKELYEATRRSWKLSEKRVSGVQTVLSIADGRVVEVYHVDAWARSLDEGRMEFTGRVADDRTRSTWLDRPSRDIAANRGPVRYIRVDG